MAEQRQHKSRRRLPGWSLGKYISDNVLLVATPDVHTAKPAQIVLIGVVRAHELTDWPVLRRPLRHHRCRSLLKVQIQWHRRARQLRRLDTSHFLSSGHARYQQHRQDKAERR